jgi:putative membrane protein insertion efficiency factor
MKRSLLILIAVAGVIAGVADGSRPPAARTSTALAIGAIHVYQATLSRLYAKTGVQCRFTPTCSHYAEVCIRELGVAEGGWLALKRVVRCGPWTPAGTVDPPPVPAPAANAGHGA